ncbi:plastidial pyruvate kinase [Salix suchowensis]|nr:plastidial pyruvate kinase [Salix suchowensis]
MSSSSVGSRSPSILSKKKPTKPAFPPAAWGSSKDEGSYFSEFENTSPTSQQRKATDPFAESPVTNPTARFETRFDSDYTVESPPMKHPILSFSSNNAYDVGQGMPTPNPGHNRSTSVKNPISSPSFSPTSKLHSRSFSHVPPSSGPFFPSSNSGDDYSEDEQDNFSTTSPKPYIQPKPELMRPLLPGEGVARAIALYDFNAVEAGDLSFAKGDIITVTKKSDSSDDWYVAIPSLSIHHRRHIDVLMFRIGGRGRPVENKAYSLPISSNLLKCCDLFLFVRHAQLWGVLDFKYTLSYPMTNEQISSKPQPRLGAEAEVRRSISVANGCIAFSGLNISEFDDYIWFYNGPDDS